jgi:nicotinamide-nucleotide amidase
MVISDQRMRSATRTLLAHLRSRKLKLAAAESCTGGLLTAMLTEIPGSSDVVERGFVTYSNEAKREMLGIPASVLRKFGAVSRQTAIAMAKGALKHSTADISVAITGIAGPSGGSRQKPVGLVHIAAAARTGAALHRELRFGNIGRSKVRQRSVLEAFAMLREVAVQGKAAHRGKPPR